MCLYFLKPCYSEVLLLVSNYFSLRVVPRAVFWVFFFFFLVSEGEVHILLLPLEIVNFMTKKVKEPFLNN